MNREYHKWWTWRLNRDMEMLVFGHAGAKVLVFPTRGGRFYEFEQMRMPDVLREKIDRGWLQFFCLDGIDSESFYCKAVHPEGRIWRYVHYEEYILNEVFPFMHSVNDHPSVISYGCSLGAYQAANIAFRHPQLFAKLAVFSGRFDLTQRVEDFDGLFDGHYSDTIYFNTPSHFLSNLGCSSRLNHLRQMEIILTVGREDPFRRSNEELSGILGLKGIGHQIHHWDGRAHRGQFWRKMAALYL